MDRRQFLRNLAATAAGIYVPTRTFFLPPEGGWFDRSKPVLGAVDVWVSEFGAHQVRDTVSTLTEQELERALTEIYSVGGDPTELHVSSDFVARFREWDSCDD